MTEKKQTYLERVTDEILDLFYPTMKKTAKETVQSAKEHPIKTVIYSTNPIGRASLNFHQLKVHLLKYFCLCHWIQLL